MADQLHIGRKLRERRIALGMSQKTLHEKSGVYQPIISAIEQGKTCGEESAGKLAEALGSTVSDLVGDPIMISKTALTEIEGEQVWLGGQGRQSLDISTTQVNVPPIHSRVGVEYQRTVGDTMTERWDRIRVYLEQPCDPELMEGVKGSLIDNAIQTIEDSFRKIAIRGAQESIPDLKIGK